MLPDAPDCDAPVMTTIDPELPDFEFPPRIINAPLTPDVDDESELLSVKAPDDVATPMPDDIETDPPVNSPDTSPPLNTTLPPELDPLLLIAILTEPPFTAVEPLAPTTSEPLFVELPDVAIPMDPDSAAV